MIALLFAKPAFLLAPRKIHSKNVVIYGFAMVCLKIPSGKLTVCY
jgi:hypothetical protein